MNQEVYMLYKREEGQPDFQSGDLLASQFASLMAEYGLVQLCVDLDDQRISTADNDGNHILPEFQQEFFGDVMRLCRTHSLRGIDLDLTVSAAARKAEHQRVSN